MDTTNLTEQLKAWTTSFGEAYTDRNLMSAEEVDRQWQASFGVRKSELFRRFLGPKTLESGRVLEVGCNIGCQLEILRTINPELELYGIEPQNYARAKCRELHPQVHVLPGSAFELPFRDGFFDVVMTNCMLIHVAPPDLPLAIAEIYRCSRRFIFLYEYFAESPCEISYRGENGLLWKMNYVETYLRNCSALRCIGQDYVRYFDRNVGHELADQVGLLEKVAD